MTKVGNEKPNTAKAITRRSIQVPAFHAAMTPIGMATLNVMSIEQIVSASVGSIRWASSG